MTLVRRLALAVDRAFRERGGSITRFDYCSLQCGQLTEAIQHAGRHQVRGYCNEMADMVSIAYQAIEREGYNADGYVARRIARDIIPRMVDGRISNKYRLTER